MRLDFLIVIGITFNLLMTIMFPSVFFGANSFDTDNNLAVDFTTWDMVDLETQKQIREAAITQKDNNKIAESTTLGQETAQFVNPFGDSSGGFLDWIGVALEYLGSVLLFIVPFSTLLWLLPNPINYFLGTLFLSLFAFSIAKFLGGR